MKIEWNYPKPRGGVQGWFDKFIGPGATKQEVWLQICFPVLAAIAAPMYVWTQSIDWTVIQYIVCALLAADMVGGLITNATSTAKRWYHRTGQTFRNHFVFVLTHILHLTLVSWLYLSFNLGWIVAAGSYLILSSVIILTFPIYLQRPISITLYAGSILLCLYALDVPQGLEWFLPFF